MSAIYTYSPSDIMLTVSGYTITGFDRIAVQRNSPPFKQIKGIRGQNTRVRNRDTSCTVTVDLIQTSLANDVLSELLDKDLQTNSVRLSLSLTDTLGNSKIESSECYVSTFPELVFTNDIQLRRWTLTCLSTSTFNTAGNARLGGNSFMDAVKGAVGLE